MKTYSICQSCGYPLKKDKKGGGTEKDGSISQMYCSMCYENGAFLTPPETEKDGSISQMYCSMCYENGAFLTPPEVDNAYKMQQFCIQEMKKAGMNGLFAWLATRPIPRLKRWNP